MSSAGRPRDLPASLSRFDGRSGESLFRFAPAAYKIKHADTLLASDENSENLPAGKVAPAYHCHRQMVYDVRKRFVERGLAVAIGRKKRATPPN